MNFSSNKGSTGFEDIFAGKDNKRAWEAGDLTSSFSFSATLPNQKVQQNYTANTAQSNLDRTHLQNLTRDANFSAPEAQKRAPASQDISRTQNGVDSTAQVKNNAISTINDAKKEIANVAMDKSGVDILPSAPTTDVDVVVSIASDAVVPGSKYIGAALDIQHDKKLGYDQKVALIDAHDRLIAAQNHDVKRSDFDSAFGKNQTKPVMVPPKNNWASMTNQQVEDLVAKPAEDAPEVKELQTTEDNFTKQVEEQRLVKDVEEGLKPQETLTASFALTQSGALHDVGGDVAVPPQPLQHLGEATREVALQVNPDLTRPTFHHEPDMQKLTGDFGFKPLAT